MRSKSSKLGIVLTLLTAAGWLGASTAMLAEDWKANCGSGAGNIKDEPMCVGRGPESLQAADEDYYRDMDYGATKDPAGLAKALAPYVPGITPEQALRRPS